MVATMRPLRTRRVFWIASTLVLGFAVTLASAQEQRVRPKDGSRQRPGASGRELSPPVVSKGVAVTVAPDRKSVREGGTVLLTVRIERGENVGHVPFHLNYDPTVLRFERAREGEFLRADGQGTAFIASPASAGSAVVVGLSRLGKQAGVAGNGELCVLEFTAIGSGDARLAFSRASVRDPDNRSIEAEFQPTTLIVR
jgi:hypothetical protein